MIVWLQFILCTAVIVYAGIRLAKYGDIIAEKTGLGRTWIGIVLLASVTSLPELITGFSSIVVFDVPNIATGNVLGSCMFNMLTIALLDMRTRTAPISSRAHQGQVLAAGYGIFLIGMVSLSIVIGNRLPSVSWIGVNSILFILTYLWAMRMIFIYERRRKLAAIKEVVEELQYKDISRKRAYLTFAATAVVIIATALWLPYLGDRIAEMTGLGPTFVGTVFVAFATALPELVISFAALRIGAVDMALGNLFGSNLFNVGILAFNDILYFKGALLSNVSTNHLISANAAIMMAAIAIVGLTYRTRKRTLFLAWDSVGIVLVYAISTWILFDLR